MQWSTEDVGVWLEHIGLGAYRSCFASLNGRMLLTLKNDEQLQAVLALPVPLSLDTQAYKPMPIPKEKSKPTAKPRLKLTPGPLILSKNQSHMMNKLSNQAHAAFKRCPVFIVRTLAR